MKTTKFIIVIIILLNGCVNRTELQKNYSNSKHFEGKEIKKGKERKANTQNLPNIDISLITKAPISIYWTDKGSFYALYFKANKVYFQFNPSCLYWFPSKIINNEIIFYWALIPNCVFDRGLEKTYSNIENPELEKPFGKIKLLSDTTFFIEYFYNNWVKKVNEEQYKYIDKLFPSYFYKKEW